MVEVKSRGNLPKVVDSVDKQLFHSYVTGWPIPRCGFGRPKGLWALRHWIQHHNSISNHLQKKLGLSITPYKGTFCQVQLVTLGASIGKLGSYQGVVA